MGGAKTKERAEAVRLRVEERKSIREIEKILGVSRGSVSLWLKDHPLTKEECRQRLSENGKRTVAICRAKPAEPRNRSKFHKMSQGLVWTNSLKGKTAEAAVLLRLFLQGYEVYGSIFDGDHFDWVIHVDGTLRRVQVKWASKVERLRHPFVRTVCSDGRRKQRPYLEGELDFLIGYDLYTDTCFVWAWEEVRGKKQLSCVAEAAEAWHKLKP